MDKAGGRLAGIEAGVAALVDRAVEQFVDAQAFMFG
jgi:hypothetical protein